MIVSAEICVKCDSQWLTAYRSKPVTALTYKLTNCIAECKHKVPPNFTLLVTYRSNQVNTTASPIPKLLNQPSERVWDGSGPHLSAHWPWPPPLRILAPPTCQDIGHTHLLGYWPHPPVGILVVMMSASDILSRCLTRALRLSPWAAISTFFPSYKQHRRQNSFALIQDA